MFFPLFLSLDKSVILDGNLQASPNCPGAAPAVLPVGPPYQNLVYLLLDAQARPILRAPPPSCSPRPSPCAPASSIQGLSHLFSSAWLSVPVRESGLPAPSFRPSTSGPFLPCPLIRVVIFLLPLHLFVSRINETKITFHNFWGGSGRPFRRREVLEGGRRSLSWWMISPVLG